MLNELQAFPLQSQSRLPIIRIPCVAHTANLALGDFMTKSRGGKPCHIRIILAALPDYTGTPFSDMPKIREEHWFSLGYITNYSRIHWTQMIGFLKENRETEALAALNRLDITRLNEVMIVLTRFIRCLEENCISNFDIFPMLQKLMVNLGSLCANKQTETLIQTVSEHFSRTTDLNVIFVCALVTPAGKKSSGAIERPNPFAASMEAMWQQGIDTLANMFSYNVAEMIMLFQDCF
jgi:hypothetical protein